MINNNNNKLGIKRNKQTLRFCNKKLIKFIIDKTKNHNNQIKIKIKKFQKF